jgi:hypothetical protein
MAHAHDVINLKPHVLAPYNLSYNAVNGSTLQQANMGQIFFLFSE